MYNINEKIEDFARQSGLYKILTEHAGEFGCGDLTNTPYPELEKFAELLIRECAEVVAGDFDYNKNWCNEKILNHFELNR